MLHLMGMGNPWELLALLLTLPPDLLEDRNIRRQMVEHAERWLSNMARCFLNPTPAQKAHLCPMLAKADSGVFANRMPSLLFCVKQFGMLTEPPRH